MPLENRLEALKKVVFHKLLGTSHDKVMRFRKLAAIIADKVNPSFQEIVDRTALLAKADLETQMVGEFSELQGIMGREYALLANENPISPVPSTNTTCRLRQGAICRRRMREQL